MKPLLIIGSYLSPYVCKVVVCLELKGIAYEVDPIVPFYGNDRFSAADIRDRAGALAGRARAGRQDAEGGRAGCAGAPIGAGGVGAAVPRHGVMPL